MSDDPDKAAVYAAENRWLAWLDHQSEPGRAEITVDGETFRPETEPRFVSPDDVARYVERVTSHLRQAGRGYDGRADVPVLVRPRRGNRAAEYERGSATIAVPPFERGGRWALRGLVVLHEVAHHLQPDDAGPTHGPAFRATILRLLEDVGCPELARLLHHAYTVEGLDGYVPHTTGDDTLARIAKLLRQAERTRNEAEQEAFLAKAQQLATRHSVALAVARAHTAREERREQPVAESVRIGRRGKKGLARYVRLLLNIAHANDLRSTITHDSTVVDLHGFPSDIAVARALYESLLVQMVDDCERHLAAHPPELREEWEWSSQKWVVKPVAKITRRLAFYEAYADRIGDRLLLAKQQAERAATAAEGDGDGASSETALALRQKELDVHDFFAEVLQRQHITSTWRGDRTSAADKAPDAADAGLAAADRARLGDEKVLD